MRNAAVKPVPPQGQWVGESKAAKFERLAVARVTGLRARGRQIANLATNNYEYTPEQAKKIVDTAFAVAHSIAQAFERKSGHLLDEFRF